jgi:hypothetical protein
VSASLGATAALPPVTWPQRLANFRIIPRIETYPAVVSFAQSVRGKLLVLALFTLGLRFAAQDWLPLSLCLAVITFFPSRRRLLVSIAALLFAFVVPWAKFAHPLYTSALVVFVLALGAMLFWLAVASPNSFIGRHPVFVLLSGYSLLVVFAAYFPNTTPVYLTVWDFTAIFGTYLWYIGYSLLDCRAPGRDPFSLQLGSYRPFWGAPNTPIAKGAGYLRRIEARNAEQLAVTQLKGLKLLAWALLIALFSKYFTQFIYGSLGFPTFTEAFRHSVNRAPYPWHICWASLIADFLENLFSLAIAGHTIVACCRMAGFGALRNTYRPLSSRTIAEFWNRYYFYFKEMMVDFFFYPSFLNFFKKHKRLRVVFATFAAAGFGNAFCHFVFYLKYISQLGLWRALLGFHVYIFYCIVLAGAISLSQLRKRPQPPRGFLRAHAVPAFCVSLFYCLLHIFDYPERVYPITEHFRFLAHLFNLNL